MGFLEMEIAGIGVFALLAGVAAALSILGFYSFVYGDKRAEQFKQRIAAVDDNRASLRAARINASKPTASPSGELALMEQAIEKLQLSGQTRDDDLRLRLARAGLRKDSDMVRFVFLRVALPVVLGVVGAAIYTLLLAKAGEFKLTAAVCAALFGGLLGFLLPSMQLDSATAKRKKEIIRHWADALDLLTICVESGMSVEQAFNRVADELGADAVTLVEELKLTTAELAYLGDRRRALENLAERTDVAPVKSIVSALIQAEKHGTPVGAALRVISAELRFERLSVAESKAAALPAKLTVPMMVFFLPVLFIVILGPSILQVMDL